MLCTRGISTAIDASKRERVPSLGGVSSVGVSVGRRTLTITPSNARSLEVFYIPATMVEHGLKVSGREARGEGVRIRRAKAILAKVSRRI